VSAAKLGVSAASILVSALALLGCNGDANVTAEPKRIPVQQELTEPTFERGARAYAKYCALCHGETATGYAADHAPSLVSATFLATATNEYIARGIKEGRPGTAMAGYAKARGGPLEDDEVLAIITFLRDKGPAAVRLPTATIAGDAARGQAIYEETCQRCHGTRTDRGDAVHLANPTLLSTATDQFLRYAIVHGRSPSPMPAFAGVLDDTQIDDVVTHLRSWTSAPPRPPQMADPPPLGKDFIINPRGKNPDFKPRQDRFIPIEEVKRALDEKKRMVILDARAASDWLAMHITGSVSSPYYLTARLDAMPKDGTWILAYCACPHHASGVVVDELKKRGFTHTAILDEGVLEWKKRGYPIVTAMGEAPTPAASSSASAGPPVPSPRRVLPPGIFSPPQ
jgi:cbb3-type cytochrome c oxidase subunit III